MTDPSYERFTGKPDALKGACPVWEGAVGKVLSQDGNSLAAYFIQNGNET